MFEEMLGRFALLVFILILIILLTVVSIWMVRYILNNGRTKQKRKRRSKVSPHSPIYRLDQLAQMGYQVWGTITLIWLLLTIALLVGFQVAGILYHPVAFTSIFFSTTVLAISLIITMYTVYKDYR